jgi:hypothetical protein
MIRSGLAVAFDHSTIAQASGGENRQLLARLPAEMQPSQNEQKASSVDAPAMGAGAVPAAVNLPISPPIIQLDNPVAPPAAPIVATAPVPREIGGRDGPEPTRYGDWEKAGRCIDF